MTVETDPSSLPRALPADAGVPPRAIVAYIGELDRLNCHSLVIVRHGKVIVQAGWKPYRWDAPQILYSVSKSFVSVAMGFAVHDGLISIDERLVDIFAGQFPTPPCDHMRQVTIHHLLTMTFGNTGKSDLDFLGADSWIREALYQYLPHEPGSTFLYDNRCTYLCSVILQQRTGMTVHDYLREKLLDPLGITGTEWEISPEGYNTGGWGLRATAEHMARFGQFLLQKGEWNGVQLLDQAWIETATVGNFVDTRGKSVVPAEDCWRGYGYFFWHSQFPGAFRADGALGQNVIVLPQQDSVVAITAGTDTRALLLERTWDTLCPALDSPCDNPTEEQRDLETLLTGLTIDLPEGKTTAACPIPPLWYRLTDNPLGLIGMKIETGDDRDWLTLRLEDGEFAFNAGHGEWLATDTGYQPEWASDTTLVFHRLVAAAAVRLDSGDYLVKIAYTQTPFVDTLTLRFDAAGVEGEYAAFPAMRTRCKRVSLMGRIASEQT